MKAGSIPTAQASAPVEGYNPYYVNVTPLPAVLVEEELSQNQKIYNIALAILAVMGVTYSFLTLPLPHAVLTSFVIVVVADLLWIKPQGEERLLCSCINIFLQCVDVLSERRNFIAPRVQSGVHAPPTSYSPQTTRSRASLGHDGERRQGYQMRNNIPTGPGVAPPPVPQTTGSRASLGIGGEREPDYQMRNNIPIRDMSSEVSHATQEGQRRSLGHDGERRQGYQMTSHIPPRPGVAPPPVSQTTESRASLGNSGDRGPPPRLSLISPSDTTAFVPHSGQQGVPGGNQTVRRMIEQRKRERKD
jgi:hypothetical protein